MLNTYIKNRGVTQTIIHDNNNNHFNQLNWDADYDGNIANISLNSNNDGKRKQLNITLDNQDLANLFNVPSIAIPIHKRLKMDFDNIYTPQQNYLIELPTTEMPIEKYNTNDKESLLDEKIDREISTLLPNEELIIPLSIDKTSKNNKYTYTPKKRHKRRKTHVTYKVYKKHKSHKSKSSRTKTPHPAKRRTVRFSDLL